MCFFIVYCIFSLSATSLAPLWPARFRLSLAHYLASCFSSLGWLGFYVSNGLMADRWIHLLATSIYMLVGESIPVVARVWNRETHAVKCNQLNCCLTKSNAHDEKFAEAWAGS